MMLIPIAPPMPQEKARLKKPLTALRASFIIELDSSSWQYNIEAEARLNSQGPNIER
jgi:hypothetical protein